MGAQEIVPGRNSFQSSFQGSEVWCARELQRSSQLSAFFSILEDTQGSVYQDARNHLATLHSRKGQALPSATNKTTDIILLMGPHSV